MLQFGKDDFKEEEPAAEETSDVEESPSEDVHAGTPEDAIEKAMKAATPEEALDKLKACGYRLEKEEVEGPKSEPMTGDRFMSMKRKAVKDAFVKSKGK